MSWIDEDKRFVWHPFTQHATAGDPLPIVKAKGTLLFDPAGKSYIDANSSWWVNTHGHGHPKLQGAIQEQFEKLDHVIFANLSHQPAATLAKRICEALPKKLERVFFSDNGSTANEVALKMCIQFWHNKQSKKTKIMALEGAYHGDTFGAMSVGERDLFNKPFESLFFDAAYLEFPTEENENQILAQAEQLLKEDEFAALIVEPLIQGAAGMRMYSASFLNRLVRLAKSFDVFVIFDEVMTGFGRTGKMFAMDYCSEKPDIVTLSKGLTAGILPMGLTVTSNDLFNSFLSEHTEKGFLHGHSYTGNPLACAVANASLDLFEDKTTWESITRIEEQHVHFLENLKELEVVLNPRMMGTILAFEVSSDRVGYFSGIRNRAYNFAIENGVLLRPLGNTIFINPPYCITQDEYEKLKSTILSFLKSLQE